MSIFNDYELASESKLRVQKLLEKWNKETKENFVYPWDWMFDKVTEDEVDKTIITLKKVTIEDSQEAKRKFEQIYTDTDVDNQLLNSKKQCGLSEEQLNKIKTLKKDLHEPEFSTSFPTLLQFLNEMSIAQIEILCKEISLSDLSEESLVYLSKHLTISNDLGINVMTVLFKNMFLQKILSLSQTPSQVFTGSFTSLSKKYPRSSCDGLALNIIKSCSELGDHQLRLMSCVIQQSYPVEITLRLFQEFLKIGPMWNENWVKFVNTVISLKFSLSEPILSNLCAAIDKESANLSKNVPFARLIQSFLNDYAIKLSKNDLLKLQKVVSNNESILKRQLANLIKKHII